MHIIKIINSTILDLLCFANNYTHYFLSTVKVCLKACRIHKYS